MLAFQLSNNLKAAFTEIIETSLRAVPSEYRALKLSQEEIGYLSPEVFKHLKEFLQDEQNEFSFIHTTAQQLVFDRVTPHELSLELRIVAEHLKNQDFITGWRNEDFAYLQEDGHELFRMERSAFRCFGLHSRAIHVNGYCANGMLWLAKRSLQKHTDPGLFDNLTAGGIGADETILTCAERELWEEAGVSPELIRALNPVGNILVRRPTPKGLHHETLYTFDLPLPNEWTPSNQDGEVSEFVQISIDEASDRILSGELTLDAAIVTADFLLRHSQ